jgi:hypothetical protein
MFVTPNELAVMYQLYSLLTGKLLYSIHKLGNTLLFLKNKKLLKFENVKDNDDDVNQFE